VQHLIANKPLNFSKFYQRLH